jgi:hypothetical protein
MMNHPQGLNSFQEMQNCMKRHPNLIMEYNAVFNALRRCQIDVEVDHESLESYCKSLYSSDKAVIKHKFLKAKRVIPNAQVAWERNYFTANFSPAWECIWKLATHFGNEPRIKTQQWKIVHHIWPTNTLLKKMGKVNSEKCSYCTDENDDLEHFFYGCSEVRQLWENIELQFGVIEGRAVKLNVCDVLLGYNIDQYEEFSLQNTLILLAKLCISKFKFGEYPNLRYLFQYECTLRKVDDIYFP